MREITEKEIMDAFREDGQFKEDTTNHFIFRAGYLAAQKTAHNSDYTKCTAEVLRYIKYSKDSKAGRDIAEIIKKHFA